MGPDFDHPDGTKSGRSQIALHALKRGNDSAGAQSSSSSGVPGRPRRLTTVQPYTFTTMQLFSNQNTRCAILAMLFSRLSITAFNGTLAFKSHELQINYMWIDEEEGIRVMSLQTELKLGLGSDFLL